MKMFSFCLEDYICTESDGTNAVICTSVPCIKKTINIIAFCSHLS